jgi:hypothetical protein
LPVAPIGGLRLRSLVSAREIISEIQRLPPTEQAEVIQFAYRLDAERMLSGKELAALAQRMIDTADPVEKLRIREELTRGFYGGSSHA